MRISASIYSNKEKGLEALVRELDAHGIDMFHIDCFDEAVFEDIARIRAISNTAIDLHIINDEPAKFFPLIAKHKVEYVSIQYGEKVSLPELPKGGVTQWGLAFIASDALELISRWIEGYDFVLFMASAPGQSGKPFNKANFQRIIDFKQLFPKKKIQVDGGVNDRIAFILRLLGVNSIVSGNYLLNREYLGAGMLNLHKAPNNHGGDNDFKVADFMTMTKYLPVIARKELTLKNALQTMEQFGLGFVFVTEGEKLHGVISNADVRRGFISHLDDLNGADVLKMVNAKPIVIDENQTLTDMLQLLNNLNFIILFLPVVDSENSLKGALLLNHLTRV
ncbi:MAG: domain containing protein [Bacteroidota bacterium]|nr:domain containing protein [Bacteroidota bacterium]